MSQILHPSQFTSRKVALDVAAIIDALVEGRPVHLTAVDRFSLVNTDGIAKQVQLSRDLFYEHADTCEYVEALPPSAFQNAKRDPGRLPREAAKRGLRAAWVRRCDLWPAETSTEIVAALVLVGTTLFVRVESSGAKREIVNFAGVDHNAYSLLIWSLTLHHSLDGVRATRWSDDAHRVGRDALGIALMVDAHKSRGKVLQFGHRVADPQDPSDALITALLSKMGEADNEARQIKMAGHTVSALEQGGVPMAEAQLPHGVFHRRERRTVGLREQEVVVEVDGYKRPYFDPAYVPVITEAVRMHAARNDDGSPTHSYVEIGLKLAELDVERRGQRKPRHPTFRAILESSTLTEKARRAELGDAAKAFFLVATHETGGWSSDPDHPAYDAHRTEMLCGKLNLWRTGIYPTKLEVTQLTGRGRAVKGRPLRYDSEDHTTGWLRVDARWFVTPDGTCELNFDISTEQWESSRQRLLDERRQSAHHEGVPGITGSGRILDIRDWYDGDFDPTAPVLVNDEVDDRGVRQFRLAPRQNNKTANGQARKNRWLLQRPAAASTARSGPGWQARGWSGGEGTKVATTNDLELCRSLAAAAERALADAVERLAPVAVAAAGPALPTASVTERVQLAERIGTLEADLRTAEADLKAFRRTAARLEAVLEELPASATDEERQDAEDALNEAEGDVADERKRVRRLKADLACLTEQASAAEQAAAPPPPAGEVSIDLAEAAWWIAGLKRTPDGTGSPALRATTSKVASSWRLSPDATEGDVLWSCILTWPTVDGGVLRVPLRGRINNAVDGGRGISRGVVLAHNLYNQGRSLDAQVDDLALQGRRRAARNLLDWTAATGCVPRPEARQALVDHPINALQRALYAHMMGDSLAVAPEYVAWRDHSVATYADNDCPAGESAACPDDLTPLHRLLAGFEQLPNPDLGVTLETAARLTGLDPTAFRRTWGSPVQRGRQTRPRWLEVTGGVVQPLRCPFIDCEGDWATVAVLLPEVWATGHGVICPTCRRVPGAAWEHLVFPPEYTEGRFTRQTSGSRQLFDRVQTVRVMVTPYALPTPRPRMSTKQVAAHLGRSNTWVTTTASQLGLVATGTASRGWSQPQVDALRAHRDGKQPSACQHAGCTERVRARGSGGRPPLYCSDHATPRLRRAS